MSTVIQTQSLTLRDVVENIAKELAPQYKGKLVVKEHRMEHDLDNAGLYIEEQIEVGKFLKIFPRKKKRRVLYVDYTKVSTFTGHRYICASPDDKKAKPVLERRLKEYALEKGIELVRIF